MSRLVRLHSGLNALRRRRALLRIGGAVLTAVAVTLAALFVVFLLDLWLHMGALERALLLPVLLVGLVVLAFRTIVPAVMRRESDVELALRVERQQGISTDLVAALQFEDARRPQYGSADLRGAVIDYTEDVAGEIDYEEGTDRGPVKRLAWLAGAAAGVWLLLVIIAPAHAGVFFQRLVSADARYPTRTQIVDVREPGQRVPYGEPVTFTVEAGGELPTDGRVELETENTDMTTTLDLIADEADPTVWRATLPRALDDLRYRVYLGDDYTDTRRVALIRPPIVDMQLHVRTPDYAADAFSTDTGGLRNTVVLAGSDVIPRLTSDKPLREAVLTIGGQRYPLRRDGEQFVLDTEGGPLHDIEETVRYQLQITDEDGMRLETPITGVIRVRPDRAPVVNAGALSRLVTPQARVTLRYKISDDYGVHDVVLHRRVVPAEGEPTESRISLRRLDRPIDVLNGESPLDFSELGVSKGDRVEVTLEATDHRGDAGGQTARGDTLVFHVTDRTGWLDATHPEMDDQMDRRLDEIIRTQLGIGG